MAIQECSVEGCSQPKTCRGLCNRHYHRWRAHGSTEPTSRSHGRTLEDRFWTFVDKAGPDDCWLWTGGKGGSRGYDYGVIRTRENGRYITHGAHRLSWQFANGEIPAGMEVDHRCHNTLCVNPSHLRIATGKQNKEHRKGSHGRVGIRGVQEHPNGRYRACVVHNRKYIHLGFFDTAEEAGEVARLKRLELFTHNDVDRRSA